jgi:hypothetical protein
MIKRDISSKIQLKGHLEIDTQLVSSVERRIQIRLPVHPSRCGPESAFNHLSKSTVQIATVEKKVHECIEGAAPRLSLTLMQQILRWKHDEEPSAASLRSSLSPQCKKKHKKRTMHL